jgi:hypothetical protein
MSMPQPEYLPQQRPAVGSNQQQDAKTSNGSRLIEQYYQELVRVQSIEQIVFGGRKHRFNPEKAKHIPLLQQMGREITGGEIPPGLRLASLGAITLDTGSITFDNGVPVGGSANFGVFPDGQWNYSGHFHNSGFPGYHVGLVIGIRIANFAFTFPIQGDMGGTISSGSRDFDWDVHSDQPNPALVDAMRAANDYEWSFYAATNLNLGDLANGVLAAIGEGATVIALL